MLAADANVVQKIVDLAEVKMFEITDINGLKSQYSTKQLHEIEAEAPALPPTVEVHTLTGFADVIRQKFDAREIADFVIHVEDHLTVTLKAKSADIHGRRLILARATPVKFDGFSFGSFVDQENFDIGVASKFAETEDKSYVLKIASSLTSAATSLSEDDGFTQKATVKAGIAIAENVIIKPTVSLAPYRTFPECRQPISAFVFRARGGEQPKLMLAEADGGKWKIDAINEVRRFISTFEDLGLPVIA